MKRTEEGIRLDGGRQNEPARMKASTHNAKPGTPSATSPMARFQIGTAWGIAAARHSASVVSCESSAICWESVFGAALAIGPARRC